MLGAPSLRVIQVERRVQFRAERLAAHLANTDWLRVRIAEGLLRGTSPDDAHELPE